MMKTGNMMIDQAGRVTRQHEPKKRISTTSVTSSYSDVFVFPCAPEMHNPPKAPRKKNKKKKRTKKTTSFSPSSRILLAQLPSSIGKSIKSRRRNKTTVSTSLPSGDQKRISLSDSYNTTITARSSMLDEYGFMSSRLPITTKAKKVVITKRPNSRDIFIENSHGKMIGVMDYCLAKELKTRILKDAATGKPCAIIQKSQHDDFLGGPVRFRVYGEKPAFLGQEPTNTHNIVNGCYLWAEIKNTGSVGGNFVMKRYSSESSYEKYFAKRFGTLFSKNKSKGFTFLDNDKNECAKMFSLNKGAKGILIAPNRDMCLMFAFCVVVGEMVENFVM